MSGRSIGWLLDGRVRHDQPQVGHRTALEPVLLAASVPARPGERVLEAGTGSGAALLCLAARVPGLRGLGVERDAALAMLATDNFAANGHAGLEVQCVDVADMRPDGTFDHALANPPWHEAGGTASPIHESARRAAPGLFALWAARLAAPLRHHGTLTFVIGVASLPACLAAFSEAGCGSTALLPLWPRPGRAARLALLRGVKNGRAAFRLLPGLVLHAEHDRYTPEADAILRGGGALDI